MDKYVFVWNCCQPPCEAVSWNSYAHATEVVLIGQPPCEAVSWNAFSNPNAFIKHRQPPCEAVSWNLYLFISCTAWLWSASLWGCELKWYTRSLNGMLRASASLWGCELKSFPFYPCIRGCSQPPCEAVSWNTSVANACSVCSVSLLVRLWVEMVVLNWATDGPLVSLLVRLWVEI